MVDARGVLALVVCLLTGSIVGAASNAQAIAYTLETSIVGFSTEFNEDPNSPGTNDPGNPTGSTSVAILNFYPVGSDLTGTVVSLDPAGTVLTFGGNIDDVNQDVFLFEVEVISGFITGLGTWQPLEQAEGIGHLDDGVAPPDCGSIGTTCPGPLTANTTTPEFFYNTNNLSGFSDRLFTTFTSGDLPGAGVASLPPGTVSFMINDGSALVSATGTIREVPEPGTFGLLGLALGGLALAARKNRS